VAFAVLGAKSGLAKTLTSYSSVGATEQSDVYMLLWLAAWAGASATFNVFDEFSLVQLELEVT
jgi:hypothetical protein